MNARTIVRRRTVAQVKKGMKDLQKQGWKPVMKEPVLDEGKLHFYDVDYYVMVMEHPTLKRTKKQWY